MYFKSMESQLKEIVAENIRFFRNRKGFTQSGLSVEIQMSWNYINGIENGNGVPSLDALEKIAAALDVEPYELLLKDGCPENARKFTPEKFIQSENEKDFKALNEKVLKVEQALDDFKKSVDGIKK